MNEFESSIFPSLKRRGGCAIKKIARSNLGSRRRGGQTGEIFRPGHVRRTFLEAAPYRACASRHPVCGASVASRLSIDAADTPPFQGGEYVCPVIHSHVLTPWAIVLAPLCRSISSTANAELGMLYTLKGHSGFGLPRQTQMKYSVSGGSYPSSRSFLLIWPRW